MEDLLTSNHIFEYGPVTCPTVAISAMDLNQHLTQQKILQAVHFGKSKVIFERVILYLPSFSIL